MATVVLLAIAVLLIDAHGPVVDCLPAVEGWLPGLSEVASIAADISHRVQVTDTAWPRVHHALRHVPWVVGRLGRFAITASETFLVNREAMAGVGSRHLPHVAIDCHGRPRAILIESEDAIGVRRPVARVGAHTAVAHPVVGEGPRPGSYGALEVAAFLS